MIDIKIQRFGWAYHTTAACPDVLMTHLRKQYDDFMYYQRGYDSIEKANSFVCRLMLEIMKSSHQIQMLQHGSVTQIEVIDGNGEYSIMLEMKMNFQ